jgi:hypothetical protein
MPLTGITNRQTFATVWPQNATSTVPLRRSVISVNQLGNTRLLQDRLYLFPFFERACPHGQQNVFAMCLFLVLAKQSGIFQRIHNAAKLSFTPWKTRYLHFPFPLLAVPKGGDYRNSSANMGLERH